MSTQQESITWRDAVRPSITLLCVILLILIANDWLPVVGASSNVVSASVYPVPLLSSFPAERQSEKKSLPIGKLKHVVGVVRPLRTIPDSLNNFRATSITPEELRAALAMGTIKKVMNLSGDVPGKMTMAQIHTISEEYGVEYLTSGTLNRFAAHDGYQEGRGYVRSAAAVARHLLGGNVLVLDRSGNRAGALIGAYLVAYQGFTVEQAIAHNNWEYFATSPGESYKYLETVTGVSLSTTKQ